LADALVVLSDTLADQGHATAAVEVADEAVDIAESLRDRHGHLYDTTYAWATYTLGQRLRDIGRDDDATVLYAEAVEVFRNTYRSDPYQRARSLGAAVTDYAGQLLRQDRDEEAVAAAQEAIGLFRAARPDNFNRPWAYALRNLAIGLRSLGRGEESLQAAQRGVHLARTLASAQPDRAGILVDNLRQTAYTLEHLDRRDEALAAAHEAVDVARTMTTGDDLGRALDTLVWILRSLERTADALPVAAEAVTAWRGVASAHPAERSSLARALADHAGLQEELGGDDADRGLAAAEEAEVIARELVESNPDRHRRLLADVLLRIWRCHKAAGQSERAFEATLEAVKLLRAERERQPAAH
jgi:tetratricopeptide (TPR) repeat protein